MNKIVIILPYFGKFPNHFQFFLDSCKMNNDIDWLIFTDDKKDYIYPNNVNVKYMSFEKFVKIVKSKFDFDISINFPKKLCDLKPLYGYIFSDMIKKYNYWGYCDCDLIFGKISNFLNFNKLEEYAKIGILGHLSFMKNTKKINEFFIHDRDFKTKFRNPENFIYDELFNNSVNNVLMDMGEKIYTISGIADISVKSSNFVLTNYNNKTNSFINEKSTKNFFIWENGRLFRYIKSNNNYSKKEYIYIHLQKRQMKINNTKRNVFKIIPNSFDDVENCYYLNKFNKIKTKHINLHKLHFFIGKVKNKLIHKWN